MTDDLNRYKEKLAKAEHKIRILEEMIERHARNLYLKNTELERRNSELQQLAYAASHDLQEPVKTIAGYVRMLHKELASTSTPEIDRMLDAINRASERMSQLIRDILDYSRLGDQAIAKQVDCSSLMMAIVSDMDNLIRTTGADIRWNKLPVIQAYETELRLLLKT